MFAAVRLGRLRLLAASPDRSSTSSGAASSARGPQILARASTRSPCTPFARISPRGTSRRKSATTAMARRWHRLPNDRPSKAEATEEPARR